MTDETPAKKPRKPRTPKQSQYEFAVARIAKEIATLADAITMYSISVEGVAVTFAHLQKTLAASHQQCLFAAQANDAGSFSLSNPAPAYVPFAPALPGQPVQSAPGTQVIMTPDGQVYEGRLAGIATSTELPVTVEVDSSGDGIMLV